MKIRIIYPLHRCLLLFFLWNVSLVYVAAQTGLPAEWRSEKDSLWLKRTVFLPSFATDSLSIAKNVDTVLTQLRAKGYWGASSDSIVVKQHRVLFYLYIGSELHFSSVENGNIAPYVLEKTAYNNLIYKQKQVSWSAVRAYEERFLEYAENNGYPFADIRLDSIEADEKTGLYSGKLYGNLGEFYRFGTLEVEGTKRAAAHYLEHFLGLRKGTPYSEKTLKNSRNRLKEIPFITEKMPPVVNFQQGKAVTRLFLSGKKASKFDFIFGVQPNSNANSGKLLFTGTILADFPNLFGGGQRFFFEYKLLRPRSPELKIKFAYPYLFNIPFGVEGSFENYKRDTLFSELKFEGGLQYQLAYYNYLKVFFNNHNTTLLSFDKQKVVTTRQLPPNLDVNFNSMGLAYHYENLDYRFNPRRGFEGNISVAAGIKTIEQNPAITALQDPNDLDFDFTRLYDTIATRSYQYRGQVQLAYYVPLSKRGVLKAALNGGSIFAAKPLYRNELYRIGGFKSLRGFDDDAFQTSRFGLATLEYRFLIGLNSYFYAFADGGYLETITTDSRFFERPVGVGGGLTFETKAGIFGLTLGFGRQNALTGFDFRAAKVHFGYIATF